MATSVIFEEQLEIPFVGSLDEFRAWVVSERFPRRGRIDYLGGCIEVDMSPADLFCHGVLKTEIVGVLGRIAKQARSGYLFSDRARVSCPEADLSVEPDVVFVSAEALASGRVRLVPKAGGGPDRFIELEGAPDLIVEIVSDSSVTKDTHRLPAAYARAGVREFWRIDARGPRLSFEIARLGAAGYEAAPRDSEGFHVSDVFAVSFRLVRNRDEHGRWTFDLDVRTPG